MTPPVTYDELIAAATVGVGQRPLEVTALAGPAGAHADVLDADPAAAVLDAAALLDTARRAGGLIPTATELPIAATPDTSAELSGVAGDILRGVLGRGDRELTLELLNAAAGAGFRAPVPDLPALLDYALRDTSVRAAVAAVLGERGRWLAAHRPEWLRVADASAAPEEDPEVWVTGRPAERLAWLAGVRGRDPEHARDLLAAGWARETGDDRAALLGVLRTGLSGADEPFLEAVLDDRKAEVRQRARRLLAMLPGSAFTARAQARAADVLRLERRGLRRRLAVTLPDSPDAAARRDGLVSASPYPMLGERGWHLLQVIAAAPLLTWTEGLGADAATLVALDVDDGFGAEVHAGWRIAARREGDADWAGALLAARPAEHRSAFTPPDEQLVQLLAPLARVARTVALLRERDNLAAAAPALRSCPIPWPAPLTDAVLAAISAQLRSAEPPPPGGLPALVARSVDLADPRDLVLGLRAMADRFRIRTAEVPAAGRWAGPLERSADLLDLRRRFHQELQ